MSVHIFGSLFYELSKNITGSRYLKLNYISVPNPSPCKQQQQLQSPSPSPPPKKKKSRNTCKQLSQYPPSPPEHPLKKVFSRITPGKMKSLLDSDVTIGCGSLPGQHLTNVCIFKPYVNCRMWQYTWRHLTKQRKGSNQPKQGYIDFNEI